MGVLFSARDRRHHGITRTWVLDSYFYVTFCRRGYSAVRKLPQKQSISVNGLFKIVIPIYQDSHWTVSVINLKMRRLEYYDSLGDTGEEVLRKVAHYRDSLAQEFDLPTADWSVHAPGKEVSQQPNGFDCGCYCIAFMNQICALEDPIILDPPPTDFRLRIGATLLSFSDAQHPV